MKKTIILSFLIFMFLMNCTDEGEPLIGHVYGWVRNEVDSAGVNDIILRIRDINPYNLEQMRNRTATTMTEDSVDGFFEIDSVCYGTTKMQGIGYVTVFVDSINNPGWPNQLWQPDIWGETDTVILYITR